MDIIKFQTLLDYIHSHPEFLHRDPDENYAGYDHMGAVLTDAMLQPGLRYETTVLPRVKKILGIPEATSTSGFLALLEREGAAKLLNWSDSDKPKRLLAITRFFHNEQVETVVDLRAWLSFEVNLPRLKQQRGVGDKTADYFKILAGLQTTAIDRHLFKFLEEAGCPTKDYQVAKRLIQSAADELKLEYQILDHNIWVYMSKRGKHKSC